MMLLINMIIVIVIVILMRISDIRVKSNDDDRTIEQQRSRFGPASFLSPPRPPGPRSSPFVRLACPRTYKQIVARTSPCGRRAAVSGVRPGRSLCPPGRAVQHPSKCAYKANTSNSTKIYKARNGKDWHTCVERQGARIIPRRSEKLHRRIALTPFKKNWILQ